MLKNPKTVEPSLSDIAPVLATSKFGNMGLSCRIADISENSLIDCTRLFFPFERRGRCAEKYES